MSTNKENIEEKVTEDMRAMLRRLSNLASQASDEVYDDDQGDGTAGILVLCDLLVDKIDDYLERTEQL